MKGTIVNYRGGAHTQKPNQMVVIVEGVSTKKEVSKLVGKKAEWTTPTGKKIVGEVRKPHGKRALLVKFEKGMPGQSIGTEIEIT